MSPARFGTADFSVLSVADIVPGLEAVCVGALRAGGGGTEMLSVDGDEQARTERVLAVRISRKHAFRSKRRPWF